MTNEQRGAWLGSLQGILLGQKAPLPEAQLQTSGWRQAFDGTRWRIDEQGFIVLEGERRPTGLRTFTRSCMARFGEVFHRMAGTYGNGLKVGHLIATAVTESGCNDLVGMSSVDNLSSGLMQVTGQTCRALVRLLGRPDLPERACLARMADDPEFSIEMAAVYMTQPRQVEITALDPPKVAAAYNAGGIYFDSKNTWRMRSTGNHIDRFVAVYNAYVAWYWEESSTRAKRAAAPKPLRLTRGSALPQSVADRASLAAYNGVARDGDTVFVGNWDNKDGDFYVFVDGSWYGSTEDHP